MPPPFHFRRLPCLAAVAVAAVGVALGQWQWRRADEKKAIEQMLSRHATAAPITVGATPLREEAVEYRRVRVKGEFLRDWVLYLENRPLHGAAGWYVLTPLKIAGSDMHVLIVRGWAARDLQYRAKRPVFDTPGGIVEIDGMARRRLDRLLQLGQAAPIQPGAGLQNLDPAQFAAASRFQVQPFFIEQSGGMQDGLVRDWPRPSLGIDKHRGYAVQWYGLAAAALLFFVATGLRRGR